MLDLAFATLASAPRASWPFGAALPTWLAPVLASAGILLGLAIIIMQIRADRRRSRRAVAPPAPPSSNSPGSSTAPLREVMRDAEELIDRLAARADAQAQRLESLLQQSQTAERRLVELQTRLASASTVQASTPAPRPAPPASTTPTTPAPTTPTTPTTSAASSAAVSMPLATPPRPASITESKPAARPGPAAEIPEHADIYELADQGIATADIARRLGQPKGEVELILSLRRL